LNFLGGRVSEDVLKAHLRAPGSHESGARAGAAAGILDEVNPLATANAAAPV